MTTPEPLTAALDLIARGIPVFPCNADKAPMTERGHLDASTDPGQVRAWFETYGGRLLWGVPTGRRTGIAVLDVDIDPAKGVDGRKALEASGRFPPVTLAHLTPRGGLHLLYRLGQDETCPTDASRLGPGLDRRGDGGYMIWWPAHGGTVLNGDRGPAAPPDWLTLPVRTGKDAIRVVTGTEAERIIQAAVHDAAVAGDGEHNATLSRSGFILGQMVQAGFIDPERAGSLLLEAVQNYPETSKTRRDAIRVIEKALRRGADNPGFEEVSVAVHRAFGEPVAWTPRGLLLDAGDIISTPSPARWLIRGVMEQGVMAMLFGEPEAGKSFLALDWALSVACGVPWMGHDTVQGPVLYVNGEGHAGFRRRVKAWTVAKGLTPRPGMFRATRKAVAFNDASDLGALLGEVDAGPRPVLVFVDTYAKATPGADDKNSVDAGLYVRTCLALVEKYGATVVTMQHAGHGDKLRAKGAIDLRGAMDSEWGVIKDPSRRTLKLITTKCKDGEPLPETVLAFKGVAIPWFDDRGEQQRSAILEPVEDGEGESVTVGNGPERSGGRLTANDRMFMQAAGYVDEATVTDSPVEFGRVLAAFQQLHGGKAKVSVQAFNRALGRALERGCFQQDGDWLVPSVWAVRRDLRDDA